MVCLHLREDCQKELASKMVSLITKNKGREAQSSVSFLLLLPCFPKEWKQYYLDLSGSLCLSFLYFPLSHCGVCGKDSDTVVGLEEGLGWGRDANKWKVKI